VTEGLPPAPTAATPATPEPAARLADLSRTFGEVVAVDGLTFEVRSGELFGLVGPDGAGKTTTLRMLAGVMKPTRGDAFLDGISVARDPEKVKHDLAYMSQRFGLYVDLTVRENLDFYADLYHVPRAERQARMKRLFEFSGLGPFQDRLAGNLSGGMKQKLGLSCALIHEPRILLLDEPTFGVDPVSRRDLWLIVHEMVARGVTVIVSTSYMDEAERFDRVALLHRGRLLALDTPVALQSPWDGRVLEVRTDRVRDAGPAVRDLPGVERAAVFGDRLHLVVEDAARVTPVVQRALAEAGFAVTEIRPIAASMEDVFIERIAQAELDPAVTAGAPGS
jgi:ABC-2 type transport system ATP-binding protein